MICDLWDRHFKGTVTRSSLVEGYEQPGRDPINKIYAAVVLSALIG